MGIIQETTSIQAQELAQKMDGFIEQTDLVDKNF